VEDAGNRADGKGQVSGSSSYRGAATKKGTASVIWFCMQGQIPKKNGSLSAENDTTFTEFADSMGKCFSRRVVKGVCFGYFPDVGNRLGLIILIDPFPTSYLSIFRRKQSLDAPRD
jgi:hypothetical protein